MDSLTRKKCLPCESGIVPMPAAMAKAMMRDIPGWTLMKGQAIRQELSMKDFMAAIRFINAVAETSEAEGHHPDIHLTGYRRLCIELSTHAIRGLSENDFILAAKINALPREEAA